MAKLNATRYALLGMLSLASGSGYDIKKRMQASTNYFWSESDGAIYPILKKLLNEKKVSCTIENAHSGKPKKVYTLTPAGRDELTAWLKASPKLTPGRDELLLKLFFGANVDTQVMLRHVEQCQHQAQEDYATYCGIEADLNACQDSHEAAFKLITLKAGMHHAKGTVQWCKDVKEILNDL